jgi:hypothetical protein
MSRLLLSALAVLAFAGPTIALAQQGAPVAAPAGEIQVKIIKHEAASVARYVLAPQEFRSYAQQYLLETGMVLNFEEQHHRYFTRLRNEPKVEIFPLAQGVFQSVNGTLFVFRDEGDSIAVSHMERLPFAGFGLLDPARVYAALR